MGTVIKGLSLPPIGEASGLGGHSSSSGGGGIRSPIAADVLLTGFACGKAAPRSLGFWWVGMGHVWGF